VENETRAKIRNFLNFYFIERKLEEFKLPRDLESPQSPEEIERRSHYLRTGLMDAVTPLVQAILGRLLREDENRLVENEVRIYLESKGI
jgi:hypothetical protein